MPPQIFEYLRTQRVGVFAIEMLDGSPHAATVHFYHSEEPFVLIFETEKQYRKAEALMGRPISRASFVVGSDESQPRTLQLDGTVELLKPEEENYKIAYLEKFTEKKEKSKNEKYIFFKFTPTWWRFTDFKTPEGKKIWTSN